MAEVIAFLWREWSSRVPFPLFGPSGHEQDRMRLERRDTVGICYNGWFAEYITHDKVGTLSANSRVLRGRWSLPNPCRDTAHGEYACTHWYPWPCFFQVRRNVPIPSISSGSATAVSHIGYFAHRGPDDYMAWHLYIEHAGDGRLPEASRHHHNPGFYSLRQDILF